MYLINIIVEQLNIRTIIYIPANYTKKRGSFSSFLLGREDLDTSNLLKSIWI
jgi:hypothetical protein